MIEQSRMDAFEAWVETGAPPLREQPELALAALMTTAAFVDPVAQVPIFDAIAEALAAGTDAGRRAEIIEAALPWVVEGKPRVAVARPLWDGFWAIVGQPPGEQRGGGELDFTLRVVALGELYDQRLIDQCEAALLEFDSVHALLAEPEVRMKTSDLEGHAPDSLATDLLKMLTAQGYDLEVIDADTVVLPGDYPAQNRTNRRILQLHDIWHLLGGYGFTGAGEVAISGFQMAQFGQNYSTRFLATVASGTAFHLPPLTDLVLNVTFDGWRHGRTTQELLALPWHERIADPISKIRQDLGMTALESEAVRQLDALTAATA